MNKKDALRAISDAKKARSDFQMGTLDRQSSLLVRRCLLLVHKLGTLNARATRYGLNDAFFTTATNDMPTPAQLKELRKEITLLSHALNSRRKRGKKSSG